MRDALPVMAMLAFVGEAKPSANVTSFTEHSVHEHLQVNAFRLSRFVYVYIRSEWTLPAFAGSCGRCQHPHLS